MIDVNMHKCLICGYEPDELDNKSKKSRAMVKHVEKEHGLTQHEYHITYILKTNDDLCLLCKKNERTYKGWTSGYLPFCVDCNKKNMGGHSKEILILKYGEVDGARRWKQYCDKQAYTNTFEYKKEKHGMTREEFDIYNKSRSVTLDTMIYRHGDVDGPRLYKEYTNKQAYAGCALEYFVEKYGKDDGTLKYQELNKKKTHSVDSYIDKYGDDGERKYIDYVTSRTPLNYSISSQIVCNSIRELVGFDVKQYYATLNKEFCLYDNHLKKAYFYDYACVPAKVIMEYNGDFFHVNEAWTVEKQKAWKNPFDLTISYEDQIAKDKRKREVAIENGYEIYYIWESDWYVNSDNILNSCVSLIKSRLS